MSLSVCRGDSRIARFAAARNRTAGRRVVGPYEAECFARVDVGATCGRPLVGHMRTSAGGRRPPLREMRIEFAEIQRKFNASCASGKWFVGAIHESPGLQRRWITQRAAGSSAPTALSVSLRSTAPPEGSGRTGRSFLTSHSSLACRAQATRPTVGVAGDRTRRGTGPRPMSSNRARRGMRLPRRCDPRNDIRKLHRNGHSSFLTPNSSLLTPRTALSDTKIRAYPRSGTPCPYVVGDYTFADSLLPSAAIALPMPSTARTAPATAAI